jgi:hypothetical protein
VAGSRDAAATATLKPAVMIDKKTEAATATLSIATRLVPVISADVVLPIVAIRIVGKIMETNVM